MGEAVYATPFSEETEEREDENEKEGCWREAISTGDEKENNGIEGSSFF
jgi:hypothetical protein